MPTYNERGNLEPMVERLRGLGLPNLSLLVVDDNSPDGTGGVADELALRYPDFMRVIHRPGKLGLGTAYVRGFLWALERNIDLVVTMDADFSHPPEALKTLLTLAQEYDVVTGSRFAKGSSLDKRWGAIRRLLSWGGNIFARRITGVPVVDATGGFRCYRRAVLEAIGPASVRSNGYAFQVEMAYLSHCLGFSITEYPIHFGERTQGKSKMSLRVVAEAFWRVLELRLRARIAYRPAGKAIP